MPELPEVETVARTLNALVAGKTIRAVTVRLPRIIQRPREPEAFAAALEGRSIRSIGRRGKFLRFELDGLVLVSHLRMEGRYSVCPADEPIGKHTHVLFHLTDGTDLRLQGRPPVRHDAPVPAGRGIRAAAAEQAGDGAA